MKVCPKLAFIAGAALALFAGVAFSGPGPGKDLDDKQLAVLSGRAAVPFDTDGDGVLNCSGTAVAPGVLLTATHCLWSVQFDPNSELVSSLFMGSEKYEISKVVIDGGDNALVVFAKPVFPVFATFKPRQLLTGEKIAFSGYPGGTLGFHYRSGIVMGPAPGDSIGSWVDVNLFPGDSGSGVWSSTGELVGTVNRYYAITHGSAYLKAGIILTPRFTESQLKEAGL